MTPTAREVLLASYADQGEAMVVQNVLETAGVPCRVGDLAHVPAHMFGIAGAMGRSVGIWVGEADVERARAVLDEMGGVEHGVDPHALEAEALAAGQHAVEGEDAADEPTPGERAAGAVTSRAPAWVAFTVVLLVAALLALALARS